MKRFRPGRWLVYLLVALAAAAALRLVWWNRLPQVTEVEVTTGDVAEVVYATGVVEPVTWAKVVPKLRDRIVSHCHCEGREVRKGDVLVSLDDDEARAQLRELEGRLDYAQRHLDRIAELSRRNVSTPDALEKAQSDAAQIRALIAAQKERIESYQLKAPIDGVVLRRDFQVGEIVSTTDVVAWVGQPKPLRIVAEIAEEDIGAVRAGQTALIRHDAFRGQRLVATVDRVTPKGDPQQKTFRAYLALPDDTPLMVGMSVEANVVLAERKGVATLPVEAVRSGAAFALDGDRLRRLPVETGLRGLSRIEIVSGLRAGDRVVSPVAAEFGDGARVRKPGDSPWRGLGAGP